MSISDFLLTTAVIAGIGGLLWLFDLNPLSRELQVYNQTCTKMILDNTYCKGTWIDDPVITFFIDKKHSQVTSNSIETQLSNCSIINRKNWQCELDVSEAKIYAKQGKIIYTNHTLDDKRQITRLQWLQNYLLAKINS